MDWRWSPSHVKTLIIEFPSILDCFLYILIIHKNIPDIWTYPVPQPFQCTLQVMSYQVGIPETNTHHHTHKPTRKMISFIMIGWLPRDTKIITCSYSWKHVNFHYANNNITVVQLNRIFNTECVPIRTYLQDRLMDKCFLSVNSQWKTLKLKQVQDALCILILPAPVTGCIRFDFKTYTSYWYSFKLLVITILQIKEMIHTHEVRTLAAALSKLKFLTFRTPSATSVTT